MKINTLSPQFGWKIWQKSWQFIDGHKGLMFVMILFVYILIALPSVFVRGAHGILEIVSLNTGIFFWGVEVVGAFVGSVLKIAIFVGAFKTFDRLRKRGDFVFDSVFEGFEVASIKQMLPWSAVSAVVTMAAPIGKAGEGESLSIMGIVIILASTLILGFSMFIVPLMCLKNVSFQDAFKNSVVGVLKNIPFFVMFYVTILFITIFTLGLGLMGFLYLSLAMNYLIFEGVFSLADSGNLSGEPLTPY